MNWSIFALLGGWSGCAAIAVREGLIYFYRYQTARDARGVEALFEVSRKKPNLKNRVEEATEQAVIEFAIAFPAHGQVRASNE